MPHVLAAQVGTHGAELAGAQPPRLHVVAGGAGVAAHAGDALDGHAGDVQGRAVLEGATHKRRHGHARHARHAAEGDGPPQQAQRVAAARAAQGAARVVRAAVVPGAQARGLGRRDRAVRAVLVGEDHQVGRDGAGVGLLEARERKRTRDELAGGGVRGRRRLVGV